MKLDVQDWSKLPSSGISTEYPFLKKNYKSEDSSYKSADDKRKNRWKSENPCNRLIHAVYTMTT